MSDDELEKLAAAMKNINPSKAARKSGMEAAMAAFDAEFASETVAVTETAEEKISATPQGLSAAPRPTGQTTYAGYVQTFGSDTMSKVKEFFTFKPKAMMMVGTCAAALFATSLYIPNTRFEDMPTATPQAVTAGVGASDAVSDAKVADADEAKTKTSEPAVEEPIAEAPTVETSDAELPAGTEVPVTETPIVETRTAELTPSADMSAPAEPITDIAVAEAPMIEALVTEGPVAAGAVTPSISDTGPVLPSDTVVITRRVVKTPARTTERVVPYVSKTETRRVLKKPGVPTGRTLPAVTKEVSRRVIKTPASTVERAIPAITKEVTGRVKQDDGSFKTVTATVVLQPASVEYVTPPPTYQTVKETVVVQPAGPEYEPGTAEYETVSDTVVVQEASTELVTIPATFETVTETIRIGADGSTTVISSETAPAVGIVALKPMADKAPAPAPVAMASVSEEVIVTASRRADKSSSRRESRGRVASSSSKISVRELPPGNPMPAPVVGAPAGKFTVFNGVSNQVVQSTETVVSKTGEILCRVLIPAKYKTITKQVIVEPARTIEREVPAVTKDIVVKVRSEDGSLKDVVRTFVVKEAWVDIDVIPAKYETRSERILVAPAREEWKPGSEAINAAEVLNKTPIIKPKPKPKPRPQSGLLTAGDYDDVLNPDLYKVYLDKMLQGPLKRKDLPYVDANNRVNIRVIDSAGRPVPMADIKMRTRNNNKMFPLRTGADGMAYLYPEFDGFERGVRLRISVNDGKVVRKTISGKMVRKGGDIEIVLDTQTAPTKNLDLLLTIDATGSMGDEMRYLQTELKAIVGRVERANPGINIRTGLVVYRDVGDDYVVREVPFTDDLEDFREALNAQNANGGGDKPEAMHTAMQTGLDMEWRKDAIKINLLVADAPPHDRYLDETWEAGLLSRTKGIHIVPLAASGVDKTAEFVMRSMAQITGGRYLFLTDDSGVGNSHAKPTVDCYIVTRLDGLVTRTISSLVKGERVEPQPGEVIRSVGNYRAGACAIDEQDIPVSIQTVSYKYKQ